MTRDEFTKKTNKTVLSCWMIIAVVLVVAYFIEFIKGQRKLDYIFLFSLITIIPIIVSFLVNKKTNSKYKNLKYLIIFGYAIFYTFVMFTTKSMVAFVYIIPLTSMIVVYHDKILVAMIYIYSIILNIAVIFINITNGITAPNDIIFFEIQIMALILSGVFLYISANLLDDYYKMLKKIDNDSKKDALTGAYNKKYFIDEFEQIFNDNIENGISLAFIDLDDFKKYNTKYGHDFGDAILKGFGKIVKNTISNYENITLVRFGGDEFIIIGIGIEYSNFIDLLGKIKNNLNKTNIKYNKNKSTIDISIGTANSYIDGCKNYYKLYKLADKRLYIGKDNGKNIIVSEGE